MSKGQPIKGYVIVCPERGVYLGDGRWSDVSKEVRGKSMHAPVFAGTPEDEEAMAELGDKLEMKEVTHTRIGFVSKAECAEAGCPWSEFSETEEEPKKESAPKKKKRR